MDKQLSKSEAIEYFDNKKWEGLDYREIATFQMRQKRLCIPFSVFHEAVEKTLGRPVWTHEFALNYDGILKELEGGDDNPTMQEIIEMLPADKTIVVQVD